MRRGISSLLLIITLYPCIAEAEPPTKPEDLLPYLEQVYKKGDIEAYANLLTKDFRYVMEDIGASWDAAREVKGIKKLFEHASVDLSFSDKGTVKAGSRPGMWIVDDAVGNLQVTRGIL